MEKVSVKGTNKVVVKAEDERWRNSSLYPEIMVSSHGRVKSRDYQLVIKDEKGHFRIYSQPAKIIDTKISQSGDVMVNFFSEGKFINEQVASLVAREFVPNENPERFTHLKFKDMNRANLNASNLYWDGVGLFAKGR